MSGTRIRLQSNTKKIPAHGQYLTLSRTQKEIPSKLTAFMLILPPSPFQCHLIMSSFSFWCHGVWRAQIEHPQGAEKSELDGSAVCCPIQSRYQYRQITHLQTVTYIACVFLYLFNLEIMVRSFALFCFFPSFTSHVSPTCFALTSCTSYPLIHWHSRDCIKRRVNLVCLPDR